MSRDPPLQKEAIEINLFEPGAHGLLFELKYKLDYLEETMKLRNNCSETRIKYKVQKNAKKLLLCPLEEFPEL